ncbi:hypothetical protein [Phaeobacter sp. S60]|uniref:hypothetical protein n=1 Tax=Phaeobacter sp. S60 TaxID=1569353 RepID=UPI00058E5824|nr:hypothetical protein [Phaeobacter sp. S60]KII16296.1 hypothetical protein OO25_07315 [Phaeobacter sp. S60]
MEWSNTPPDYDSFKAGHAYYWFFGLPFNRAVIVCVHKGAGINIGPSGEEPPWRELNADFPEYERHLWKPHWPTGKWAGPISEPES